MEPIVRAVDVGFGNTKYVSSASGMDVRCASFPSLAYPSARAPSSGGEKRKTVAIPINGLHYEVGPDIRLAADTFRATQLHDRYTDTPEYLALLRGALALMRVEAIDLLVLGLPVSSLAAKRATVEKLAIGAHDVGGGRQVSVRKALVVAQPQGALVHYAAQHGKLDVIGDEQSLIIDPGARTFDWLVARGMRLVQKQSHSLNRGVFDVLQVIASEISSDIGTPYTDLDAIDQALRSGKRLMIYQRQYDLSKLLPIAQTVAQQAVSSMMQWIGADYAFQNIVLVGGGAYLFRKAVKAAFPQHRILEVKDPLYANVRGFQLAGMNYALSATPTGKGGSA
ncbi:PRTRC system protein D [Xanthomonas hortorum]|uniref:PRTRC system protein D n=1 Tax=Xanthomonas hortorum pv. hederae TaxID=453603 RepID=A0A9X4H2M0_9XANT|nr:PRTRC system protein D [Xanthomonas hortorum]MCE4369739.1 PRTRC system protein D [Xanthomonas hortorum pv. hederae]MDC8638754.1 PRTRC system protein D [Xanthomonas hortorum pv. hederae]PPU86272.1 PRTRC system protein D [Xanthomonas hortorum pv. hederae]PUF01399.1 PRTRC system protein D [Xanthomonas hortorum pv. hederae]